MRGDLAKRELNWIQQWRNAKLYERFAPPQRSAQIYFMMARPHANAAIHIGHAVNKVLKDIVRFRIPNR
jgi:isoleucyl-tRNA synthetase